MHDTIQHTERRAGPGPGWDRIGAAFSLLRPVNAVITFGAIVSAGYIASPDTVRWTGLIAGGMAGALIGSGGNIYNDIMDIRIDRINRPHRALPSGRITPGQAGVLCILTTAAGLVLSLLLGAVPFLIAVSAAVLMTVYSRSLKSVPVAGNCAVGALTAGGMLFGAAVAGSIGAGLLPGLFAFLVNTSREVVKDMEDVRGDASEGVRTFPLRAGMRASRVLVSCLFLAIACLSPVPWATGFSGDFYIVVIGIAVVPLLIFLTFALWFSHSSSAIPRVSAGLKAIMILGIIAFVLGTGGEAQ